MKLRFLKLMLLLFILPLQMLAAELGVAGKQLAALPGVSNVETLKSTHFPEKYVFFIKQFPMTGSGKIQKFRLREMALEMCQQQGIEIV